MFDQIKSTKVKKINDAFNFGQISDKELNTMASFEDHELAEFLYLIQQEVISNDVLAYYFVVYNQESIKQIEKDYKYDFINELLAIVWVNNYLDQKANDMFDMLLGLSFLNSDVLQRVRKGLAFDSKKLNKFEIQVETIIKAFIDKIDEGSFYQTLTTVPEADNVALSEEDNVMFVNLRNDLKAIYSAIELYEINHGNFTGKQYLEKDQSKLIAYEEELRTSIKEYFAVHNVKEMKYLPDMYKEVILGAVTGETSVKETEEKVLKGKKNSKEKNKGKTRESDLLGSISTIEREEEELEPVLNNSEDKIFGAVGKLVNGKKKSKMKETAENTPLDYSDILVGVEAKNSSSLFSTVFKVLFAVFLVMAIIGWGLSVRSNNTDGADHVQDLTYKEILSYKMSDGGEMKYDMKINRSNSAGNVINGTVKDSTPNIE